MAKKKKENQSRFVDGIVALVMTFIMSYFLITTYQMFTTGNDIVKALLDFRGNYLFLAEMGRTNQMVIISIYFGVAALFYSVMTKKPKGYKDASEHGAYGNSQFSDVEDIREDGFIASSKESKWSEKDPYKALGSSEGIILGTDGNELVIIPPDSKLDNRNVLVVGSSGSSKGQAFVINNIINHRSQTIVVTDPKGELYGLTSDIKRDQGYHVHQIDFLNLKGSRYNPLDYVTNDIEAVKISNAISINSAKDVKQDFFFNTARDLLTGLIIYCINEYDKPNISRTVKGLFNKISNDEEYLPGLCEGIGENHPAYQYLKDASASTGNTRTSILSSFAQQTGVFSLSDVGKLTEDSDFDFHELQEHKTILYVKIPVKDNPVPALTATFFDQLISVLYQIGDQNESILPIPTIFLLDEFANLGKLHDYDNTLSTCRGYNLSMMTIVQDFAQLEGKYSKELARTIISNHDTTLFLRTKDTETAKYFERLAGETTIRYETKSSSNSGGWLYVFGFTKQSNASRSTNEQYIKKPLISESDLLSMKGDKCYVFMTGHKVELEKAFQSKIYRGFITGTQKEVVNGVSRFPYSYPTNRESYIKRFNLQPYKDEVAVTTIEKPKTTVLVTPPKTDVITETVRSEDKMQSLVSNFLADIEKKKTISYEEEKESLTNIQKANEATMQSIVINFFNDIDHMNPTDGIYTTSLKEGEATTVTDSEPIDEDTSGGGYANAINRTFESSSELTSDPSLFAEFREAATVLPKNIERGTQLEMELHVIGEIGSDLQLSDKAKVPVKQIVELQKKDPLDQLPM